jgi:hypothetical protein
MDEKEKTLFEETMKSMGVNLEGLGLTNDMIKDPEKIKTAFSALGKAWSTKGKVENENEALKYSVRSIWSLLPSISGLSAMLLVVATFNHDLIEINLSVKIIITILLVLIPLGLWGNYIDSQKAVYSGLERLKIIMKEDLGKDVSDQINKTKKPSLLGFIPPFMNFVFTFAIILIILLIWKIDLIALFLRII